MSKELRSYQKVTDQIIQELKAVVGNENIIIDKEELQGYSHDEMAPDIAIIQEPDIVVRPKDVNQISKIMKLANKNQIPVTPRGAGTGLSGGAVPVYGGIVLTLEKLNRILEVDEDNLMMTVEAGVPFLEIYNTLKESTLFFPPHPGDESAQIGGAAATNAGGARTVKYGVIRDFVKGAEVVLPDGRVITVGGKLMKNNTGYNLLHLLLGSEGTLGIFTKITLRLLPKSKEQMILILTFNDVVNAIKTVPAILKQGIIPLGIEYIERECLPPTEAMLGLTWPAQGQAFLMIILVGENEEELYSICENMEKIAQEHDSKNSLLADRRSDQDNIMALRSNIYEALKKDTIEIIDIVVPPKLVAQYVQSVKEVGKENAIQLLIYGHAADGNVHVHIMKTGLGSDWKQKYSKVKGELFEAAKMMEGVITAEHGIGAQKIPDLHYSLTEIHLELMQGIKKIFDPNNIMNPGKVLP
ncbi:FAD-binding oxidoreductase [[Eubacterium] cellulosolvens]